MTGFRMMTVPLLFRVALGLLGVSAVFFLAGFSSSHWMTISKLELHFGLWSICSAETCRSLESFVGSLGGHIYVGRAFGIGQLVGVVVSLTMLCLFAFKANRQQWAKIAMYMALFAGIIGFFGAVIFIGREKSSSAAVNVSWSGILVILASFMQIGAGICLLLPIKRGQVEYDTTA